MEKFAEVCYFMQKATTHLHVHSSLMSVKANSEV